MTYRQIGEGNILTSASNPRKRPVEIPASIPERIGFGKIPYNPQRLSSESIAHKFASWHPSAKARTIVGLSIYRASKNGDKRLPKLSSILLACLFQRNFQLANQRGE